jgi:hypothetical protein
MEIMFQEMRAKSNKRENIECTVFGYPPQISELCHSQNLQKGRSCHLECRFSTMLERYNDQRINYGDYVSGNEGKIKQERKY